jgi:beta-lactamase superfamily II metal-dependent hydrolase
MQYDLIGLRIKILKKSRAKYPSGFNLGESVITPYLHAKHIQYLDKVIISQNLSTRFACNAID